MALICPSRLNQLDMYKLQQRRNAPYVEPTNLRKDQDESRYYLRVESKMTLVRGRLSKAKREMSIEAAQNGYSGLNIENVKRVRAGKPPKLPKHAQSIPPAVWEKYEYVVELQAYVTSVRRRGIRPKVLYPLVNTS